MSVCFQGVINVVFEAVFSIYCHYENLILSCIYTKKYLLCCPISAILGLFDIVPLCVLTVTTVALQSWESKCSMSGREQCNQSASGVGSSRSDGKTHIKAGGN